MATITQRLAFLISANADGAIKAFDKTANAAEKQLGKTQKSIDRLGVNMTKFGAVGLAAAGTLGTGLFKLAQGAIEDQKAQELLAQQLRSSTGATEAQIAAVEKSIDTMARATGVADDQLRPAFGNLVRATGDLGKSQMLLQTAMDISAATGRDLETVTLALGKAANGQIGALTRLGIPLTESTKKSKDFDAALREVNANVSGAASAAANTYAGKMAQAQVAISEAGESIGTAFIPFIEQASKAVASGVNAFNNLNTASGGLIGKFAAFGTVGLGAVSALSLIGGQVIKLRENLLVLDANTGKFTGKLTTLGKVVGTVSVGITAATALYALYASGKEKAAKRTETLTEALQLEGKAQVQAFAKVLEEQPALARSVDLMNNLGFSFVAMANSSGEAGKRYREFNNAIAASQVDKLTVDAKKLSKELGLSNELTFEQAQSLFLANQEIAKYRNNLLIASEAASIATGSVEGLNDALGRNGDAEKSATDITKEKIKQYFARQRIERQIAEGTKRQAEETAKASKATKDDTEATKKNTEAKQRFKAKVEEAAQALRDTLTDALEASKQALADAKAEFDAYANGISSSIMSTINFGNAQQTAAGNSQALTDAVKAQTEAQSKYSSALSKQAQAQADYDEAVVARDDAEAKFTETLRRQGWAIRDSIDYNAAVVAAQQRLVASTEEATAAQAELGDRTAEVTNLSKQPSTFLSVLQDQATQATTFAGNIEKLLDLGADKATIDRLTESGAEVGNQIAEEILSSSNPAQYVDKVDKLIASTQSVADKLGLSAASKFKQAGVDNATNYANGVQSIFNEWYPKLSEENLAGLVDPLKTIAGWADIVRGKLSAIGSVSAPAAAAGEQAISVTPPEAGDWAGLTGQEVRDIASWLGGFPSMADGGIVKARAGGTFVRIGEGGRDEAVIPLPAPSQMTGGQGQIVNVTINVNGGDPNAVVEALKRYVRSNGALPNSIKVSA